MFYRPFFRHARAVSGNDVSRSRFMRHAASHCAQTPDLRGQRLLLAHATTHRVTPRGSIRQRTGRRGSLLVVKWRPPSGAEGGSLVSASTPQRVLILGGGFGGIYAALELEQTLARDAD